MDIFVIASLLADGNKINTLIDQELMFDISKTHLSYCSFILAEVGFKDSEVIH